MQTIFMLFVLVISSVISSVHGDFTDIVKSYDFPSVS